MDTHPIWIHTDSPGIHRGYISYESAAYLIKTHVGYRPNPLGWGRELGYGSGISEKAYVLILKFSGFRYLNL